MTSVARYASPLGELLLAAEEDGLTGLWFAGQKHFAVNLPAGAAERETPVFRQAKIWLDAYFAGDPPGETPPLHLRGTPFQLAVWALLRQIPYGETVTYGALARQMATQLGSPSMSAQAVGNAVGRNPIALMVPCHRVLGADGRLTGYAGGLARKTALLQLEGIPYR